MARFSEKQARFSEKQARFSEKQARIEDIADDIVLLERCIANNALAIEEEKNDTAGSSRLLTILERRDREYAEELEELRKELEELR